MSDPFYRPPEPSQVPSDQGFLHALIRRHRARTVSAALALGLIVAIWLVWRLG